MKISDELMQSIFIFRGIPDAEKQRLLSRINPQVVSFKKGECIYSPDSFKKSICFILLGECEISSQHSLDKSVPLNKVGCGGSFGILAALGTSDAFPTYVTATKDSCVLFITDEDLRYLMHESNDVAINIINFLTDRISFLNSKLFAFSGENAEQKVASMIFTRHLRERSPSFEFNKKRAAEALNLGRASMYRALDSLKSAGIIDFDNKKIYIKDLEGLERIAK